MHKQFFSIFLIAQLSAITKRQSVEIDGETVYMFLRPVYSIDSFFAAYLKLDFEEKQDWIHFRMTIVAFMLNDETQKDPVSGLLVPGNTEPMIKVKNVFGKFDAKELRENLKKGKDNAEAILDTSNLNRQFRDIGEKVLLIKIKGLFFLNSDHIVLVKESESVVISDGRSSDMQGRIITDSDFEAVWNDTL